MANEITFLFERATRHELVYKCTCTAGAVGTKRTGQLLNQPLMQTPNIGVDAIAGSPIKLLLSQALPNGVTELADLEGSAGFNGSLQAAGALDVWLTPGTEQQLVGATDYTQWGVTVAADATSGFPDFLVQGPSGGGTCTLSLASRHSRVM